MSITLRNLSFAFTRHGNYFFKNVTLDLQPHTIYAVQGKNGSGKSTFFRVLQGNISAEERLEGTCTIDGVEYSIVNNQMPPACARHINMVQQDVDSMLADNFTVRQNIQIASLQKYPGLQQLPLVEHGLHMIRSFGIDPEQYVHQLSGGQRQLLAIVMVLQQPIGILLLDEPTAALDEKNAHMVMQHIQELARVGSITILIISHDTHMIAKYALGGTFYIQEQENGERTIVQK